MKKLLIAVMLFFSTQAIAFEETRGLYALPPVGGLGSGVMNHPSANGVSIRQWWAVIEQQDNVYDWSTIDDCIAEAVTAGKYCTVRVIAGKASPSWVLNATPQVQGQPVPWKEPYYSKWIEFIGAMGARYADTPEIILVHVTGAGEAGEMHMACKQGFLCQWLWKSQGYTSVLIAQTNADFIEAYALAFPDKQVSTSIANPVNWDNNKTAIVQAIVDWAYENYGDRFSPQNNGLNENSSCSFKIYCIIANYLGITKGFQMVGVMGFDLAQAIQNGINAGATYLEIYAGDYADPNQQGTLEDAYNQLQ